MITIIVLVVVFLAAFALFEFDFVGFCTGLFASFFAFTVLVIVGFGMAYESDNTYPGDTSTVKLTALSAGSESGGSFFLGSGYVDEERVINYVAESNSGAKTLRSVDAEEALIYEDASVDTARLVKTQDHWKAWWYAPWHFEVNNTTEFHVPAGTVSTDFEVTN